MFVTYSIKYMKISGEALTTIIAVQNKFPIFPFKISPEGYIVKLF